MDQIQGKNKLSSWISRGTYESICNRLHTEVYGQEEQIERISQLLWAYFKYASMNVFTNKYHFIVAGPSGCGKTTFAKALTNMCPVPVYQVDGSHLCAPGWKGTTLADLLIRQIGKEINDSAGMFICIVDEVDKSIQPNKVHTEPDYNRLVMESLLKALDGGIIFDRDGTPFDCRHGLFILLGAFDFVKQLEADSRQQSKPRKAIGFSSEGDRAEPEDTEVRLNRRMLQKWLGSSQFMGRLVDVVEFGPPSRAAFERMMEKADQEISILHGFSQIPPDVKRRIIDEAMQSEYGGRYIRQEMWDYYLSHSHAENRRSREEAQARARQFMEKHADDYGYEDIYEEGEEEHAS